MATGSYTCPSASICAASPDACQDHLTTAQLAILVALTTAPLLSILWLPLAGAAQQLRWGSSPKERQHRLSDAIGVSNGMLVVLASLALGFTPTFYLLLASRYPCATGLGGCGSISCVCGNYLTQGYAWMITTLFGGVVCVLREAAALDGPSRAACATGACMVLLTAIFPEKFSVDPTAPETMFYDGYLLHVLGLGGCTTLLVLVPFTRVCLATSFMAPPSRCRALLPRTIHVGALVVYGGAFLHFRPHGPDISDYCAPIRTEGACAAWPSLPPVTCSELAHTRGSRAAPVPARYTCTFINASLTRPEQLLYPPEYVAQHGGACKKARCRLVENSRSISLEFGMLFLVGAYITSYTRVDLAWAASVSGGQTSFAAPTLEHDGEAGGVTPLEALRTPQADAAVGLVRNVYGLPWAMPTGVDAR